MNPLFSQLSSRFNTDDFFLGLPNPFSEDVEFTLENLKETNDHYSYKEQAIHENNPFIEFGKPLKSLFSASNHFFSDEVSSPPLKIRIDPNVISAKTRYRQMQESHLAACLAEEVSFLPDDVKVLYFEDLPSEEQELMLKDRFYHVIAAETQKFLAEYFNRELTIPLTKEAYQILLGGLEDVLGTFNKNALTLEAVLRIVDDAFDVSWDS